MTRFINRDDLQFGYKSFQFFAQDWLNFIINRNIEFIPVSIEL